MTEPAKANTAAAPIVVMKPVAFGKRIWCAVTVAATALICVSGSPAIAHAAAIKVLCANGMKPILSAIVSRFEAASGDAVILDCTETGDLMKRIAAGQAGDLYVVPKRALKELIKQGKIAPAIKFDVASTTLGLAVRDGAPLPADASIEAFREWLRTVHSIVLTDPAAGGVGSDYFLGILDRLGIADAMRPRLVLASSAGSYNAELVAAGKVEVAVQLSHLIRQVQDVQLVPLPAGLELEVTFAAGIASAAADPVAAASFIRFLTEPAAVSVIKAAGMEAGGRNRRSEEPRNG
ncbi:MAG TPA: substrate-binding domain-containing protein [Thermomicrobiaceae bacterium]|nr:substrate-binding domain-containing protein [Thermomicrobiaceae bacterium]